MGTISPVGHPHVCPTCQKTWTHATYSCEADEQMPCAEHAPKAS